MQRFSGHCLCGKCQFLLQADRLDMSACHCTRCKKGSGGIAMYPERPARLTSSAS
ncbi:GFA family protein [Pantoea allii]|uniref:GFA family protein n=1 Tax=Pantoea allii TaxID=574096 RepID=UPI003FCDDF76